MNTISNEDFAKFVMKEAQPCTAFEPAVTYDPDGDCVEFVAKPDPFYAERVDDLVTVYYSHRSREVIGSLIKGVSQFCREVLQRYPGFKIEIRDGRVKLEHIFRAHLWGLSEEQARPVVVVYEKLIQVAAEVDAKTELALA